MGRIKLPKNKKYSYTPRYYDDKGKGNPFEIKHKFDEFRTSNKGSKDIRVKINNALNDLKNNPDREASRRTLIIVAILVLVFLFIIDFDLSIFFSK